MSKIRLREVSFDYLNVLSLINTNYLGLGQILNLQNEPSSSIVESTNKLIIGFCFLILMRLTNNF